MKGSRLRAARVSGVLFLAVLWGCAAAGPPAQPPAARAPALVPTQPPADLGLPERYVWQTVEQMREAVVARDAAGFLAKVSSGFYRGYARMERALETTFARAERIGLVVAIRDVQVEEDRASARVQWERMVTLRGGGTEESRGESVLVFLRTDTLRLIDFRLDDPFGIALQ